MHVALAGTAGGYFVADFALWLWALCIFALIVARQVMEWANSATVRRIDFGYFQTATCLGANAGLCYIKNATRLPG